jgi:hypothetical protein
MAQCNWTRRLTVEECLYLAAVTMRRDGVFRSGRGSRWILEQQDSTGRMIPSVGYTVVEVPGRAMGLKVSYELSDRHTGAKTPIEYLIEVTTTRPRLGGLRYWFLCPVIRDGVCCRRRVGRLYLPPGQQVFGCRLCHSLTYSSSQTHNKRINALRRDPLALLAALTSKDLRRSLLGIRAYSQVVGRLKRGHSRLWPHLW